VELGELALKKLKSRARPIKLEYTWEAVLQDDGRVVAQRVYVIKGKQSRGGGEFEQYNVTKWVEVPGAAPDATSA
jgi:hypothetical protein